MREDLMLKMIEIYGFENEITISFCRLCENQNISDDFLELMVEAHELSRPFI